MLAAVRIDMSKRIVKALKILLPLVFYSLLLVFLFLYLRDIDVEQFKKADFVPVFLILSIITGLASRYWSSHIWLTILKGLGTKNIENKTLLRYVYAKSWLGRYIPGTAPWILGKIYFASQQGISKNKLAVSSVLEAGLQITVVTIFASALLLIDPRLGVIDQRIKIAMGIVILGGLIVLMPPVFNRLIKTIYSLLKRKTFNKKHYIKWPVLFRGAYLYLFGSVLVGVSLFFIVKAIYPQVQSSNVLFVIGTSSLASSLSMLAIFAPSGLGVREGMQIIMLSLIMPKEIALIVAVSMRIWGISMDLLFFSLTRLFLTAKNKGYSSSIIDL